MGRTPVTLAGLARQLTAYRTETDRRLGTIEDLVKANGLNGAAPILYRLTPLADAAGDLVDMATAHKEQRELATARAVVDAAAKLSAQRRQARLEKEWLYRATVPVRRFIGQAAGKVWYAALGAMGVLVITQAWAPAARLLGQLARLLPLSH